MYISNNVQKKKEMRKRMAVNILLLQTILNRKKTRKIFIYTDRTADAFCTKSTELTMTEFAINYKSTLRLKG